MEWSDVSEVSEVSDVSYVSDVSDVSDVSVSMMIFCPKRIDRRFRVCAHVQFNFLMIQ